MLKYVDVIEDFNAVPNHIALSISISGCPNHCAGCHSPWLAEESGTPLTTSELSNLLHHHCIVDCVCFMGGDREPAYIKYLSSYIKEKYPLLKICWYTGTDCIPDFVELFDYIKIGPYRQDLGPLNSPITNQRFYKVNKGLFQDLTHLFQKLPYDPQDL